MIQLYFDGLYEGDTEQLARAFHSTARLYSLNDGAVQEVTRDAWLAAVAGRPAPKASGLARTDRIVSIEVTDDALATATAECSIHPRYFVDHLAFVKIPEHGWQIVAKAFSYGSDASGVTSAWLTTYMFEPGASARSHRRTDMETKVALITGASSGIGLEIAQTLLSRGYSVVAASRTASRQQALADPTRFIAVDGDVAEERTAARAVEAALSKFGKLDLLVNNAGIFIAKRFTEYTADDYAKLLATNLAGFFHMTQHALRAMENGHPGHIVNIGTTLSSQPVAGVPSALPILIKGGIEAATRSLAIEYAPHGIRVNTVAAGIIDTPMHPKENHGFLRGLSPAGRIGTPQEIADAVFYLDSATFVSGEVLHLDGGAHAGKWA